MKKLILLFLFTISATAQIKGVVKDSITKEPIAYASIWLENKSFGVSSEIDGTFTLEVPKETKLQISVLGYKSKITSVSATGEYLLAPNDNLIEEILIQNLKNSKTLKVGISKKSHTALIQGQFPQIIAKKFDYDTIFKQTPFLKEVEVFTKSPINNATFKLRIFKHDKNNDIPGEDLVSESIIIKVKKGQRKNIIDVSKYMIKVPKEGIVIGVENIIIQENMYVFSYNALPQDQISYAPQIVLNNVEQENSYSFYNLKWYKRKGIILKDGITVGQNNYIEPAINLILTN